MYMTYASKYEGVWRCTVRKVILVEAEMQREKPIIKLLVFSDTCIHCL